MSPAAVEITPSRTTAHPSEAAARVAPAMPASSNPPRVLKMSNPLSRIRMMEIEYPLDHICFMGQSLVVHPGAPAGSLGRADACDGGDNCRSGGGIADAHFSKAQNLDGRLSVNGEKCPNPVFQGLDRLWRGHGRFQGHVSGTRSDFGRQSGPDGEQSFFPHPYPPPSSQFHSGGRER